ncbi:hypothetical protein Slin14017_G012310 [Septoria linicola]|nr:hypothetical protein Slin14017_G012310 [Septoria linicola]
MLEHSELVRLFATCELKTLNKQREGKLKPGRLDAASTTKTALSTRVRDSPPVANDYSEPEAHRRATLLGLPAELRDHIFRFVIEGKIAYLHPKSRGRLAIDSALPRVNRQVRKEFLGIVYQSAPIEVQVKTLGFRHLVTFLNSLTTTQHWSFIKNASSNAARVLDIKFELADIPADCAEETWDRDYLFTRWLKRLADPNKRALEIATKYEIRTSNAHSASTGASTSTPPKPAQR